MLGKNFVCKSVFGQFEQNAQVNRRSYLELLPNVFEVHGIGTLKRSPFLVYAWLVEGVNPTSPPRGTPGGQCCQHCLTNEALTVEGNSKPPQYPAKKP